MRDTVTAPGLSGETPGCGGVVDTTGGARGAQWARDGRRAGPAEPAGFQFRARSPLFRSPLVDAALVEQFADVFPCLLGSSPFVVAPDWGVRVEAVETRKRRVSRGLQKGTELKLSEGMPEMKADGPRLV